MRRARVWIIATMALLATAVPAIVATAEAATDTECDVTPTAGPEPRHPYLGRDAAIAAGQSPVYSYGENPYVYTLFVPSGLPDGPVPLLVGLHGLGQSARGFEQNALMDLATREHFIVALPSGQRWWRASEDSFDVKFIRDVVADVRAERCIDGRRIWAMGHSNGAGMGHRLACNASDLFAAVSVYAGKEDRIYPLGGPCRAGEDQGTGFEPTPIRFLHGTADATVAYEDGRRALRDWADRFRCDTKPIETLPTEFGTTEVYGNCHRADVKAREAATGVPFELRFHTLNNHAHGLPDGCGGRGAGCEAPGSEFPTAAEANAEMYAFLARHGRAQPAREQAATDPASVPVGDPVRLASWTEETPDRFGPHTELVLVGADGTPLTAIEAVRERVVRVEYSVQASEDQPDEVLDNHPECPSTRPGSRKIRIVGAPVTLRITDAGGSAEYVVETAEQAGTGLAVATFPIPEPHGGPVRVEVTTDLDHLTSPTLCITRDARFQETLAAEDTERHR